MKEKCTRERSWWWRAFLIWIKSRHLLIQPSNQSCSVFINLDSHQKLMWLIKEYVKFLNRLYDITWFWAILHLINSEAIYEKCKLFQTRLYLTCSKIEDIPYNLIFTTKCNDSSILIRIISWDYLNLSLANEYVGDVTIPT